MVDVKLESLDIANLPKDLYLSLRVGEAQKLARCSTNARHFKFPEKVFADRRYGKVEVFRHIGSGTFSVGEDFRSTMQELSLHCTDDRDDLRFRITMGGQAAPEKAPDAAQAGSVSDAKKYLEKHQLELRMAEAMDLLLRDLPEDPIDFLFSCLRQSGSMRTKVAKVGEDDATPPKADVPAAPVPSPEAVVPAPPVSPAPELSAAPPPLPAKSAAPKRQCAESIRKAAAGQLLSGVADGRLEDVLASKPRENADDLRREAREALELASMDGTLMRAIGSAGVSPVEAGEDRATEKLRTEAREMLFAASGNGGKLDEALASLGVAPKSSDREQEELREQLAAAASDGRLIQALDKVAGLPARVS